MKFPVFIFLLVSLPAQPQLVQGTGQSAGTSPAWGNVIESFAKDSGNAATHEVQDAKLLDDTLTDEERAARRAAARALAPAVKASGAASPVLAASSAGANRVVLGKPDGEGDWAKAVSGSLKDIVRPFQDMLSPGDSGDKPGGDPLLDSDGQPRVRAATQDASPKSGQLRETEKIRTEVLVDQLIEELKPWAFGAAAIAALGLVVNVWVTTLKRNNLGRKPGTPRAAAPTSTSVADPEVASAGKRRSAGRKRRGSS